MEGLCGEPPSESLNKMPCREGEILCGTQFTMELMGKSNIHLKRLSIVWSFRTHLPKHQSKYETQSHMNRRLVATVLHIRGHKIHIHASRARPQCRLYYFSILFSLRSAASTLCIAKSENRPASRRCTYRHKQSFFSSVIECRTMSNWMWCDLLRFLPFFSSFSSLRSTGVE